MIDSVFNRLAFLRERTSRLHILAALGYALLTILFTYPLTIHLATAVVSPSDPLLVAWDMAWIARQLVRAPLHLFDANIFYPLTQTLAFDDLFLGQTLLVLPILNATGNPILAHNLATWLSFVLSGWTMYLLAFHWTHRAVPAFLAGFIFAFFPYRMAHLAHVNLLTLQWLPLMVLYLTRMLQTKPWKNVALLVLFSWLQFTSSLTNAYIIAITLGVFSLVLFVALRPARGAYVRLGVTGVILILAMLPLAVPYIRLAREFGLGRSLEEIEALGATLTSYLAVPAESWLYAAPLARFAHRGNYPHEHILFTGFLVLGLAGMGVLFGSARRICLGLGAMGGVAFLLSFGPRLYLSADQRIELPFHLPYAWLYDYLPGFQGIRAGVRFDALLMFALAGLSAFGTIKMTGWAPARARPFVLGALFLGVALEFIAIPIDVYPVRTGAEVPPVYAWLAQQSSKPLVELPIGEGRTRTNRQMLYNYYAGYHWRPLVAPGFTSYQPPYFGGLLSVLDSFPSDGSLRALAEFDVDTVVLHGGEFDAERWARLELALKQQGLNIAKRFGKDVVVTLPARAQDLGALRARVYTVERPTSAGESVLYLAISNPTDHPFFLNPTRRVILASNVARVEFPLPFFLEGGTTFITQTVPCCVLPTALVAAAESALPVSIEPLPLGEPAGTSPRPIALSLLEAKMTRAPDGEALDVELVWRVESRIREVFLTKVSVSNPDGISVAHANAEIVPPSNPTARWRPGEHLVQKIRLPLALSSEPRRLTITLRDSNTQQLLLPLDARGTLRASLQLDVAP